MLGFLANGEWGSQIKGIDGLKNYPVHEYTYHRNDGSQTSLQSSYQNVLRQKINANGIKLEPNVPLSYWTFRIMIGLGMIGTLIGVAMLIAMRGGRNPQPHKWLTSFMIALPLLPLFGISFGWIFTEMGRQPWIVAGVLPTTAAVSPGVSAGSVLFSTILYTVVYGILAIVEVGLFWKALKAGLPELPTRGQPAVEDEGTPLSFAY